MDKNRLWIIGAAIVIVAIVAVGWVVAVQPQLDAVAAADTQRQSVDQTNAASRAALVKLQADFKNIDQVKAKVADLSKSVPTEAAIPAFVDELNALAAANGVTVSGITVSDALAYKPVAPPVAAASTDTSSSSTPTPSPSPSSTPAPAAPVAGVPPVTSPLITPANFAAIPVTVDVLGPYANVLNFVKGAQSSGRLFLVTSLSTTASSDGSGVDGKLGGLVYVLLQPATGTAATASK
ncbi:hypothetical protein [Diaminobutyricibacter sp. McL0608]|uniref:hypothetical protein n=1 Tax=Leifsonia sp. McL0608 TaxID=3143537 RepID=UPI0031F2F4A8